MIRSNVVYLNRANEVDGVLCALRETYPNANALDFGKVAVQVAKWVQDGWSLMCIMDEALGQLYDMAWERRWMFERMANTERRTRYEQRKREGHHAARI